MIASWGVWSSKVIPFVATTETFHPASLFRLSSRSCVDRPHRESSLTKMVIELPRLCQVKHALTRSPLCRSTGGCLFENLHHITPGSCSKSCKLSHLPCAGLVRGGNPRVDHSVDPPWIFTAQTVGFTTARLVSNRLMTKRDIIQAELYRKASLRELQFLGVIFDFTSHDFK